MTPDLGGVFTLVLDDALTPVISGKNDCIADSVSNEVNPAMNGDPIFNKIGVSVFFVAMFSASLSRDSFPRRTGYRKLPSVIPMLS